MGFGGIGGAVYGVLTADAKKSQEENYVQGIDKGCMVGLVVGTRGDPTKLKP